MMSERSKDQIEKFRNMLLDNRMLLKKIVESEKESSETVELDQSKVGRLSRMDALQGQAMTQETKLRHEEALRNISSALSRIESGDYGHCLNCEEVILTARLEADPATSLCINCASLAEKASV